MTDPGSDIDRALAVADLRVLAMCLHHMTGEDRWLEAPYRPVRDVRLIGDPSAGFDVDTQDQIRAAAREWLMVPNAAPVIGDPGPDHFATMLSVFLGEVVPDEYVPMLREDFGFDPADTEWVDPNAAERAGDVLIVGAGVSGLCLGAKLTKLGIDVRLVEKNSDVGGTWFENRYPGCGVDTPNHFYSYSFAPNPDWQHFFSPRDELQQYVEDCADAFGIRDRISFDTTVEAAVWDDEACRWTVSLRTGNRTRVETAAVFVCATGHFNQPVTPTFAGQNDYSGDIVHTANWPRGLDLTGKRVAVIGTGASAMQLVPTIADAVQSMTIFQRTPQWARPIPEYDQAVDSDAHWLFGQVPFYDRWYRFAQFWRYGDGLLRFLRKDPDWPHPERSLNRTNDRHRHEMADFIESKLATRPDLLQKCLPSYPPFAKRILIDNGWFDTLCKANVQLVTDPIERFTTDGVRTVNGTDHEVDIVIMATGFNVTNLAARIDIVGRDGRTLAEEWADDDPQAFLGMTVPGFPNMFVMYGPNTNMGHGGSGIWLAETQTRYITDRIVEMAERRVAAIECRPERRDRYSTEIDERHAELVWTHPGTGTYYRNRNGQVRSPMPFRLVDYWSMTRRSDLSDFIQTAPAPV